MLTPQSMDTSPEGIIFLQQRVALYAGLVAALGGLFWLFRTVMVVLGPGVAWLMHGSMMAHLGAVLSLAVVWLLLRRGEAALTRITTTESIGLVVSCACYAWMGVSIPLVARPEMVVLAALNISLMARAVFVPSTGRRTFALTAGAFAPLVVMTWWNYSNRAFDLSGLRGSGGFEAPQGAIVFGYEQVAGITIEMAVWCVISTLLATATSRVIYGLRKEAKDAQRLGQYNLEAKLGEGGMGIVYRASHAMLRRPTAVKLLPPHKAGEKAIARFEREVQLTARLAHPNTVTVFDYGRTPDGVFYYAMELLEGVTLERLVAVDGPQPAARVVHILTQVAGSLDEAHGIGLIHRDIKPANIMLGQRGGLWDVAKVLDFGLVKDLDQSDSVGLSSAHVLAGTPLYLPPEAIMQPDRVGPRSDLYALGCVGYFLIAGEHVFGGSTVVEVCGHHLHSEPARPSERLKTAVPAALEDVLLTCLAKDPEERFASARALLDALAGIEVAQPWGSEQADAWWRDNSAQLNEKSTGLSEQFGRSLAIDIAGRGAGQG